MNQTYLDAWIDHTGCLVQPDDYSMKDIEMYAPAVLEELGISPQGKGKSDYKKIRNKCKDPKTIASVLGKCIVNKVRSIKYLLNALTFAMEGSILDSTFTGEAGRVLSPASNSGPPPPASPTHNHPQEMFEGGDTLGGVKEEDILDLPYEDPSILLSMFADDMEDEEGDDEQE